MAWLVLSGFKSPSLFATAFYSVMVLYTICTVDRFSKIAFRVCITQGSV